MPTLTRHLLIACLLLASLVLPSQSAGQGLLDRIKRGATDAVKDKAREKATEQQRKSDEAEASALIYAISLTDDAGAYEARDRAAAVTAKFMGALTGMLDGQGPNARGLARGAVGGVSPVPGQVGTAVTGEPSEPDSVRARRLTNSGEWLYRQGSLRLAKASFETALWLFSTDTTGNNPWWPRTIGDLGLVQQGLGRFAEADSLLTRAAALRARTDGADSPAHLAALNNLAVLAQRRGDYERAEALLDRTTTALARANRLEPQAIALNNRAMLHYALGRYPEAESGLRQAFALAEQADARGVLPIQVLGNRAAVAAARGQYVSADSMYAIAISRQEKRLGGRQQPDIARLLNGQASLYLQMGRTGDVEPLLQQALTIYRRKFGENHPSTAASLHNLGSFYRVSGQLDKAEATLAQASALRRQLLGPNHPDAVETAEGLALTAWAAKNYSAATERFRTLNTQHLANVKRFFAAMSEPEKARYWAQLRPRFERFTNYALAAGATDPTLLADAYDLQLATKAILLSSTTQVRERILSSKDAKLVALYQSWQRCTEQLAYAYTLSGEDLREASVNLDSLEQARNGLEKQLAAKSAEFAGAVSAPAPSWKQVQGALKPGEAAVELLRVRQFTDRFTTGVVYAALVVTAGAAAPAMAMTDQGAELEGRLLTRYRRTIKSKSDDATAAQQLYDGYWGWIAPALQGAKTAILSLDGVYTQLNLATLRAATGKYVIESLALRTVVSTRDLPAMAANKPVATKSALLLGAADFGTAAGASPTVEPLPGTLTEVTKLKAQLTAAGWTVSTLLKTDASESKVKTASAPRVLHVATHGFFLPDVGEGSSLVFGVQPERAAQNPLLRSGLLLAGAEKTLASTSSLQTQRGDNGILTAFEAITLNLRGTELVVLSACETGLGEVQAGEGVFGLQRAIQLSGARNLIFSLWRVDDAASQELMSAFYRYWLAGRPLASAFQQAQLDLKAKYPQPYYWGAFVLIGG